MTVGRLMLALAARWRPITTLVLIAAVAGSVVALLLPPQYDASVTFYPEPQTGGPQLPPSLANLATQVGIATDLGYAAESPRFYAGLATSASVLEAVLVDSFGILDSTGGRKPLLDILRIRGKSSAVRMNEGKRVLLRMIDVSVSNQTNVVTLNVSSGDPVLSAGVANELLHEVNRFNVEKRSSRAGAKRVLAESRKEWAQRQLHGAEEAVRDFLSRNREFQSSPTLRLQYDGLQRQVQLAQELYVAISRELEQVRLQEVNDIPVLTVIDTAEVPVRRSRPKRKLFVLAVVAIVASFVVVGVAAREIATARIAQGDRDLEALLNWWRQSATQNLLRRLVGRGRERALQ